MQELNADFGIDLASVNDPRPIDWPQVKTGNPELSFAYIKAIQNSPGSYYVNPDFGTDYFGAKNPTPRALKAGVYIFWDFSNPDIAGTVAFFKQHYTWKDEDLRVYIDAEDNPTNRPWSDIRTTLYQAREELIGAGYPDPGFYMNRYWRANLNPTGVAIWEAQGEGVEPASIMQFAPKSLVGISTPVDFNVG